jgi:benzoate 4-monooxygenase
MYTLLCVQILLGLAALRFIIYPTYNYFRDPLKLRRFPGVSVAPFTNAWGVLHQFFHTRTVAVHKAHLRYGKTVRVGPSHISFSTVEAIRDIYGHGTPALKDNFYVAFTPAHLNVSDAQDKNVHSIKRKRFAAAFAQKNIEKLEPVLQDHLNRITHLLDESVGEEVDMRQKMVSFMYNISSVIMFSFDPHFLEHNDTVVTAETLAGEKYSVDMYPALCSAARIAISASWAPRATHWIKTLTRWRREWSDGDCLRDAMVHLIRNRLRLDTERIRAGQPPLEDIMTTLLFDTKDKNEPLCLELGELVTEAQNMFSASGENTQIALTNIVWLLVRTPSAAARLREELDDVYAAKDLPIGSPPTYDMVKDLPYLRACIDEAIRLRPSLPGGLPRIVPAGGMHVAGEWFDEGVTLSVSTETVHRDPAVFHDLPEEYRPERWLEPGCNEMQRGFLGFSQGGRACLGRNIAYFEMALLIATLFSRYEFALRTPNWDLEVVEAFSGHTKELPIRVVAIRSG